MAGNSNDKKKALIVFMLLFLTAGGGIFLFMVVQGSNNLIGQGKEFSYGSAAREGVSSFFKYIGMDTQDERIVSQSGQIRAESKGIVFGEPPVASADISDWMSKPSSKSNASASPTSVPRMGAAGLSGVGGIGSGGSKSSGGVSRYGDGDGAGNTSISKSGAGGAGGAAGKGTLAALTNARAVMGEGLRSGSAMTAKGKWDSSFGVGGRKGGEMAYNKGGLVNLDGIKKGEIDNLKMANAKSLKVTEPGDFKRDEKAEAKDSTLQAAKEAAKEEAEAAAKKAAMQAAMQAALNGPGGTSSPKPPDDRSGKPDASNPSNPSGLEVPQAVQDRVNSGFCTNDCSNGGGKVNDTNALVSAGKNGNFEVTYLGEKTINGVKTPNVEVWELGKDGSVLRQIR